jgi:GTPase SAR1 family protein
MFSDTLPVLSFYFTNIAIIFFSLALLLVLIHCILHFLEFRPGQYLVLELVPPSDTEKSAYSTQQLFKYLHSLSRQQPLLFRIFNVLPSISLEIVSSHAQGIRFLVRIKRQLSQSLQQAVQSYLPYAKISVVEDYVEQLSSTDYKITEMKLSNHFAYPLQDQSILKEHDPLSYFTTMMTKMADTEHVALQYVITPYQDTQVAKLIKNITSGAATAQVFKNAKAFGFMSSIFSILPTLLQTFLSDLFNPRSSQKSTSPSYPAPSLSQFEKELQSTLVHKLKQPLFSTRVRFLAQTQDPKKTASILQGLSSSFGIFRSNYQSLVPRRTPLLSLFPALARRNYLFRTRSLTFSHPTILSASEMSDLYHFPFASTNQVESVVKVHSKKLPIPLSQKASPNFDTTFAKNCYAQTDTPIGLHSAERARHLYILGATGSGKTTLLYKMISEDIQKGKSVCVLDPHGDLATSLLDCIPLGRSNDVIYFNPFDIAHPIGINLLQVEPNLSDDDRLLEHEFITESVVSLFRKVFSEGSSGHPHRIEYILRNTIHTALTTENPTIFTIFNLLNDPPFQKSVVSKLQDQNLLNFWKYEFGKAGDYQKIKMVSPVTARIGRFLFSPSAKRVLEQPHSTINFDQILNQNKIMICNLAKGNIGEDTSEVMGVLILNKLQLSLLRRSRSTRQDRHPLYLYVDEFQNFATPSFVQMLSESRKYGLHLTIAEQSTSQQHDRQMVNTILANVGNVISFRTANPQDEDLLLRQFSPYITKGDLPNLPAYNFYIKTAALQPQEPFSGETIVAQYYMDTQRREKIINSSRQQYAIKYVQKEKIETPPKPRPSRRKKNGDQSTEKSEFSVFPEDMK